MKVTEIALAQLQKNEWNPNRTSLVQDNAIRESIEEFGDVQPIVVRKHPGGNYEIIDGEHRVEAARSLNKETINAVIVDVNDTDAKRLTIVLNETRGHADKSELSVLLNELYDEIGDELKIALPYDDETFAEMLSYDENIGDIICDDDFDDEPPSLSKDEADAEFDHVCFKIIHPSSGSESLTSSLKTLLSRYPDAELTID